VKVILIADQKNEGKYRGIAPLITFRLDQYNNRPGLLSSQVLAEVRAVELSIRDLGIIITDALPTELRGWSSTEL